MTANRRGFESGRRLQSRREEGVALIVVMLILALVSVLAVSSMETTMRDQQVAGVQMRDRVAFQAAEAGLATALVSVSASPESKQALEAQHATTALRCFKVSMLLARRETK